jgi:hypothetical protein
MSNPFFLRAHRKHSSLERRLCQTPILEFNACESPVLDWSIADTVAFTILEYANRQVHAKDAGGATGGTGPGFAG